MSPKLVLDTNAYRALDDGNEQLVAIVRGTAQIGMPLIVLGELYFGIFAGARQAENLANLRRFLASPRIELLDLDEVTAKFFGEVASELKRIGKPSQQNDIWIAALCKQHGHSLATRDRDFKAVTGLEVVEF